LKLWRCRRAVAGVGDGPHLFAEFHGTDLPAMDGTTDLAAGGEDA